MSQRISSQHANRFTFWKRPAAKLCLLASAALFCLSIAGDGLAFERRGAAAPARPAAARPVGARPVAARPVTPNFGRNASPFGRGSAAGPAQRPLDHPAQPQHPLEHGPQGAGAQNPGNQEHANQGRPNQAGHGDAALDRRNPAGIGRGQPGNGGFRNGGPIGGFRGGGPNGGFRNGGFRNGGFPAGFARNGLPHRPFPGETGFTGVPPRGETRFVSNEMVFHVPSDVSPQRVDAAARRLGLVAVSSQNLTISGGTLFHFRIDNGRQVSDVVRDLETENIGVAQPNYVYRLQQDTHAPAPALPRGDPAQYVVSKLRLPEVHKIATGAGVLVAMIDSQVDTTHPDLNGAISGQFDAVGKRDKPDEHGTEMTGAIVAHRKLLGVAPHARILAIHAFSPEAQSSAQTTTEHILAGIDWAIAKGARIINMSFAGPYDPMLSLALKKAHDKGIVLIAAAGNAGPDSPPLYPAADENVIAVTAIDENDKLLPQANQGPHIALSAPGVNILETAPNATYGFTTGTSVATAHVSGVAALIIERDPTIDVATLEEVLYSTARNLGPKGRDSQFGFGLVDPFHALNSLDAKMAMENAAPPPATPPLPRPVRVSATSEKITVSQVTAGQVPVSQAPVNQTPATPVPATHGTVSQAPTSQMPPNQPPVSRVPANQSATNHVPANPVPLARGPGVTNAVTDFAPVAEKKKLAACLQQGTAKGIRGPELRDYTVVCLAEARLTCLKQAVAQKVRGPDRQDFMGKCLGS
jgi:subtilisin family serine protease